MAKKKKTVTNKKKKMSKKRSMSKKRTTSPVISARGVDAVVDESEYVIADAPGSITIAGSVADPIKRVDVEKLDKNVRLEIEEKDGDIYQQVVSVNDNRRGFRGRSAEQLIFEYFKDKGYDVQFVANDRKDNVHADLLVRKGKRGRWKKVEVKEIDEKIKGEKGRVQVEKEYIEPSKEYFIVVNREGGGFDIYKTSGSKVKSLVSSEKSPAKIELSQIESMEKVKVEKKSTENVSKSSRSVNKLKYEKGWLLPAYSGEVAIPKPKMKYTKKGELSKPSRDRLEKWRKDVEMWNEYVEQGKYPFWAGKSNNLVPFEHFENLPRRKAIAEKDGYFSEAEKTDSNNYTTTKGNHIQIRMDREVVQGVYSQRRSGASEKKPTPTLFKTKEVRVDDDDIGHYIAFLNSLYAWGDGYLPYMYVKKGERFVARSPDPLKVNRAHVKSMLDTAGYRQANVVRKIIRAELKAKDALVYRDVKGSPQDLSLSEQQLAIAHALVDPKLKIIAKTPHGMITFDVEEFTDFDVSENTVEKVYFVDDKAVVIGSKLTSDDLLLASVRKWNMEPETAQALAESLFRQGWITYPRTDSEKAEVSDVGIELIKGRNFEDFNGSKEERKILQIIYEANKALASGKQYFRKGRFVLKLGDTEIFSNQQMVFADERTEFQGDEVDLSVEKKGKNPEELTQFLIENEIGTPATRTQLLAELRRAGIITTSIQNNERIYRLDQRGLYMASAYDYLLQNPKSKTTELGRRVKNAQSIEEVKAIWESFEFVDEEALKEHIERKVAEYLELEKDISMIDSL